MNTYYGSCYGGDAVLSHTGQRIAMANGANIEIWGLPAHTQDDPQATLANSVYPAGFRDVRWSLDDRILYAIANNQVVALDVALGKILETIDGFSHAVGQVA